MDPSQARTFRPGASGGERLEDFEYLSGRLLQFVRTRRSLAAVLPEVLRLLLEYCACDEVELQLKENGGSARWVGSWRERRFFSFEVFAEPEGFGDPGSGMERLRRAILAGHGDPSMPYFTAQGSFWTEDGGNLPPLRLGIRGSPREQAIRVRGDFRSMALIPLRAGDEAVGILEFRSRERGSCPREAVEFLEKLAQILGILLLNQRSQEALRERLKELSCLYEITRVMEDPGRKPPEILQAIAGLLPPAWQYPEIASARIELEGQVFGTENFDPAGGRLPAAIAVQGQRLGVVEVAYGEKRPALDEGPFLKEERSLINAVAAQLALFWERRKAEEDKISLQETLRHADRLATIGQMAAGVAHELNEPLSNILGFAQLAEKCPGVPGQALQDLGKIIEAVLHSREIVRRLLTFGRPVPPKRVPVPLNAIAEDALYLFEGRCAKAGIEILRRLDPTLPDFTTDPIQMNQVFTNLLANAVQAMPDGGVLTLETGRDEGEIVLCVADTGTGMDEETLQHIFEPFFSTKRLEDGTGLGLSVVRDIVKSNNGTIRVESRAGEGSRFEIRFPRGRAPQEAP